jgi:hypothetical protein
MRAETDHRENESKTADVGCTDGCCDPEAQAGATRYYLIGMGVLAAVIAVASAANAILT